MSDRTRQIATAELLHSSKERCGNRHGLVAGTAQPVLRLQDAELGKRRGQFLELIGGVGPEFDKSHLVPDRSRYCMLVTDRDGFVIDSYTPAGYEAEFQRGGIVIGGFWDERSAGTNGIDMALRTEQVMTVQGKDHFHKCFHGFACSSTPLHDAQSNLIGTITLVGSAERRVEEVLWCEQILRGASDRFQSRLFRKFHGARMTARLVSQSPDRRRRYETMVACDDAGTITSSLPLWQEDAKPPEHQNLQGRHLSDLRNLTINVHGPAMVPPRRRPIRGKPSARSIPLRAYPSNALTQLIEQGGGLEGIVGRARKILSHRVPLLICGETGLGKAGLANALLDDLGVRSPMVDMLDGAQITNGERLKEALAHVSFLAEFPVEDCTPVLVILNVECLDEDCQEGLQMFLRIIDMPTMKNDALAARPLLIFTVGHDWQTLQEDSGTNKALLYMMGQSVLELPPIRQRKMDVVLDGIIERDVEISDLARQVLANYDWPGNLREMRAVIREAMICGNGQRINLPDLPPRLTGLNPELLAPNKVLALREALDSSGWNITKAAKLLGKSRATVNRWIVAEGLRRPE